MARVGLLQRDRAKRIATAVVRERVEVLHFPRVRQAVVIRIEEAVTVDALCFYVLALR